MTFLIDTNVLSEARRGRLANPGVVSWFASIPPEAGALSVMTIAEIRRGILLVEPRDGDRARLLSTWLEAVRQTYAGRILPIDDAVAAAWAEITVPKRRPEPDGLIAATAIVHGLQVVTRNTKDFEGLGLRLLDPFV